jgi:hypothetical protein
MTTPTSGANVANPTHHVVLTDPAGTSLGLMICDPTGKNDPTQIRRAPYPRTGLKITQGATKYADKELPFADAHQEDWSGGRAALNISDDLTRYYDSYRAHTEYSGMVTNAAQESYANTAGVAATDFPVVNQHWPNPFTFYSNWPVGNYADKVAVKFTTADSYTIGTIHFILSRVGTPNDLYVYLFSDNAGSPDTNIGTLARIAASQIPVDITKEVMVAVPTATFAMTTATSYWLVFSAAANVTNYWQLWSEDNNSVTNPALPLPVVKVGNSPDWGLDMLTPPFFRVVEERTYTDAKFFEFKGATYCVRSRAPNTDVNLYINGDRGVADASAAGTLVDAAKTWGTTQWVGATVRIIRGTGSNQPKPYRTIASHTNTTLTLSSNWDVIPDTTTEYVICNTNVWNRVAVTFTSCKEAYDVAVAGDFAYIATDISVWRYCIINDGGVFTEILTAETTYATRLLSTYDSANKCYYLWGAANEDAYYGISSLWKMRVPPLWGALYNKKADLLTFDQPWDDIVLSNVTMSKSTTVDNAIEIAVGAGFTTGMLAAKYLTTPIDITEGTRLNFPIKSSVTASAGNLKLILSQDSQYNASGYTYRDLARNPDGLFHYTTSFVDAAGGHDADMGVNYDLTLTSTQYIYIVASRMFDTIHVDLGTTKNTNDSTLTAEYMSDGLAVWTAVTITDGTKTGIKTFANASGDITFTPPADWKADYTLNSKTGYCMRLKVSADLTASINLTEIRVWSTPYVIDLPAVYAGVWTWVSLTMTPLVRPFPDDSTIKSIGLYLASDLGAQTITLKNSIEIAEPVPKYISIQTSTKIKRLIQYGEERGNPWLICEDGVYEVQTENSDLVVKLPLDELKQLADPTNGMGAATNDVYLYWNMGEHLERYYSGKLEDLGPDRDEGLPAGRQGIIRSMISYPGAIYAAVSGCYTPSVLTRRSSGWHEVYRGPICFQYASSVLTQKTYEIYNIFCQSIPGDNNRLWIAQKDEILSILIPKSKSDEYAAYTYQSVVITPWIDFGFLDVSKRYIQLKLYTEDLAAYAPMIAVDYQLESGDLEGTWTRLSYASNIYDSTRFETSPFESKNFPTSASGRRIRLRFVLETYEAYLRPILKAWILEAVLSLDISNSYVLPVRLSDHATDLQNNPDETARMETLQAQIDTWSAAPPTILTMTSIYSPADNKTVIVQPMPLRPYKIQMGTAQDNYEAWIAEVTLLEVA